MKKVSRIYVNGLNLKRQARAGEFYSINNKNIKGHIGEITKVNKNGEIEVVILTHAKRTFGKKNIQLIENPNPLDEKKAYVVKHRQSVNIKQVGTKRDNLKITNVRDKSLIRKIKSSKKKKVGLSKLI